jgi:hypothetical protein
MYKVQIPSTTGTLHLVLLVLVFLLSQAAPVLADIHLAIQPAVSSVDRGEIFDVELTVTEAGSEFNGFDAFVGYDPSRLTFIQQTANSQQGSLLQEACSTEFHNFSIAGDSTSVGITYIILCAGVSVTGPGVVYNLRFQAKYTDGPTSLSILPNTQFYNAGIFVTPLITEDGVVVIGTETDVPSEGLEMGLRLRAAPNPFNPQTVLSFEIPHPSSVNLAVYTTGGRRIKTLINAFMNQGPHEFIWDGKDQSGRRVASGSYRVFLEAAGLSKSMSVVLVK